jgi:L-seryl-tRNA(Ser) seleniumtransferase
MIMLPLHEIQSRAQNLADRLTDIGDSRMHIQLLERASKTGGGALPLMELPSLCVGIQIEGLSVNSLEKKMRNNDPPIIGRIEDDLFIMDPRTIQKDEYATIAAAFENQLMKA